MKKSWINRKMVDMNKVYETANQYGICPELAMICLKREYQDLNSYLFHSENYYKDGTLLPNCAEAVSVITPHIVNRHPIAIINDYDVDGITSGYIAFRMASIFGSPVRILTSNRIEEGYGISRRMIDEALSFGARLIITTDNGIAAYDEIEYARACGIDVVITDHHEVPYNEQGYPVLPNANAIIDPKLPNSQYPFKDICGATVIYKLALEVLKMDNLMQYGVASFVPPTYYTDFYRMGMELVGLATIADIMPLIDENRYYVRQALYFMRSSAFIGLRALFTEKKIDIQKLNSQTLAFSVIPCLNAISRMTGDSSPALQLLASSSYEEALVIAKQLNEVNEKRKKESDRLEKLAFEQIENSEDKIHILYLPNALHTLCGIVAGRITEVTGKPCFVCAGGHDDLLVGSGRSVKRYDLITHFRQYQSYFAKLGGHSLACGGSLTKENFATFKEIVTKAVNSSSFEPCFEKDVDIYIQMSDVSNRFITEMEILEPYGEENEVPVFVAENVYLYKIDRFGSEKQYLRFYFSDAGNRRSEAILFRGTEDMLSYIAEHCGNDVLSLLEKGETEVFMDVMYLPQFDTYNGVTKIQFLLKDIRIS